MGSDICGLIVAKKFGIPTGGTMPFGFKTQDGPKPEYKELYGMVAHSSSSYVPRTRVNVKNSDGTLRLAFDFNSPGEKCTKKAIISYKKPFFDVDLNNPCDVALVCEWLKVNNIKILNVAGNTERTATGITKKAIEYLTKLFESLDD